MTNFVNPAGPKGEFICQLSDVPDEECIVRSTEAYRLPRGAVVLSTKPSDLKQVVADGRTELRIERTIQPGSLRELSIRYRLPQTAN